MSAPRHPNDLPPELLSQALAAAERPDLLQQLVDTSRRIWGVFTNHFQYTINYPWVAAHIESLPAGSRLLDVGAGATPLPLFFAERGFRVDTVDPHPVVRTTVATRDWNEWGFFDYSQLHANLKSHHCTIAAYRPDAPFDAVYSVSVFAHLTRLVREDAIIRCRNLLRPGGRLLLAIDLIPGTNFLWNRSAGHEVEPTDVHGTIYDVLQQMRDLDFDVLESEGRRQVAYSGTDLAFIAAARR